MQAACDRGSNAARRDAPPGNQGPLLATSRGVGRSPRKQGSGRSPVQVHVMRVLVRTPNWLGDIVMALPVFAALRHHFAGDVLAAGVPRVFAPLLSAVPGVDLVVGLRGDGARGWRALAAEAAELRSGRFDLVGTAAQFVRVCLGRAASRYPGALGFRGPVASTVVDAGRYRVHGEGRRRCTRSTAIRRWCAVSRSTRWRASRGWRLRQRWSRAPDACSVRPGVLRTGHSWASRRARPTVTPNGGCRTATRG